MGHMPDWYPLIKAGKILGCKPWELLDQSPAWVTWALGAEGAELRAEHQVRNAQKSSQQAFQQWSGG
jgi:hypothetical protein